MNIFLWHVHGSWTTAFVQGPHRYLVPVDDQRSPWGRGRAQTWTWPPAVVEVNEREAADAEVDLVLLQRAEELDGEAARWLGGRRPGLDVPAVYVEHNAPQGRIDDLRHPAAGADGITIVHVTFFNDVFWDCGNNRTVVIEHGIVDPGYQYSGDLARQAAVINEPVRRWKVTGADLLPRFAAVAPLDLFGMGASALGGREDLPQHQLHAAIARRRVYVHPLRWTSLGLSLIEAMHLGMPVTALATTEVTEAVPDDAGVTSTSVDVLVDAARRLVADPEEARAKGKAARAAALSRYGLGRFLDDWDQLIQEVTR